MYLILYSLTIEIFSSEMKALADDKLKLVLEFLDGYWKPRCAINEIISCLSSNDKKSFTFLDCRKRYHLHFLYVVYTSIVTVYIIMIELSAFGYTVTNIVGRKSITRSTLLTSVLRAVIKMN